MAKKIVLKTLIASRFFSDRQKIVSLIDAQSVGGAAANQSGASLFW